MRVVKALSCFAEVVPVEAAVFDSLVELTKSRLQTLQ